MMTSMDNRVRRKIDGKELIVTSDHLDALWGVVNERRDGTKSVKVPVEALMALLNDYHIMIKEFE